MAFVVAHRDTRVLNTIPQALIDIFQCILLVLSLKSLCYWLATPHKLHYVLPVHGIKRQRQPDHRPRVRYDGFQLFVSIDVPEIKIQEVVSFVVEATKLES